jgi:hypothetical protein
MTLAELRAQQAARKQEETRAWVIEVTRGRTFAEAARHGGVDRSVFHKLVHSLGLGPEDMPECLTVPGGSSRHPWLDALTPEQRRLYRELRTRKLSVQEARMAVENAGGLTKRQFAG